MIKSVRRLAEQFAPAHYNITLDISKRVARTFSGTVTIRGDMPTTASHIALHAKELQIARATIDDAEVTWRSGDNDELILESAHELTKGPHTVHVAFSGTITDPMHGIYPCYFTLDGVPKELVMTQFENHYAREAFPCIDEPIAKATYDLTLITEPGITTLSNTPITHQQTAAVMTTTFATTPKMSSYLLAFVVGELAYKEATNQHGVTVRAYATPDKASQLDFALDAATRTLDFLDDYFAVPFPLPKCDIVACPDFAAGAMENWGLATFREAAMLVEPDTPPDSRQYIFGVIAHELAHQWFGDLVTMEWWDDLWLNESFANWMEYYANAHFHPEWQIWPQIGATEQQQAFARDALAGVQTIQQRVNHPDEVATLFDPAIVYAKGGSLIRMLHEYLGDETFREGLRIYMRRHAYGNTTTKDLWVALGEASGKDIAAFMEPWTQQAGHPVVDMTIHDVHATVSQRRFYASPTYMAKPDATIWPVPLLSSSLPDAELLTVQSSEFVVQPADFYLLNEGGTGFYHTRYDAHNAQRLAQAVSDGKLNIVDRQRLLLDAVALNRPGLMPAVDVVHLLQHYNRESNYAVWLAMSSALGMLRVIVNEGPKAKPHLQRFIADMARTQFERLDWQGARNESHFDAMLRPIIISNMAYAEDPAVTKHCLALFDAAKKPEDITSDIRSIVYSVAARERGASAVDRLIAWYKTTPSADERVNLCAGISTVKDPEVAQKSLALITTKTVKLQDAFYWFVYHIRNWYTRDVAWQWMVDNWSWIQKNFGGDYDYGQYPKYASGALGTPAELAKYKAFFEPKLDEPALARIIKLGIEDINIRIDLRKRDMPAVTKFLQTY